MDFYILIPLIEVSFCLALLAMLIVYGQHHIARKPFGLFLFFMALWGFFIFMMRSSANMSDALFWEKFVFWGILSAAMFFYRFTRALTGIKEKGYTLYFPYAAYLVSMCLIPTELIVRDMQMMWYGKAPLIGPLFFLYVLSVYIPLILGLMALIGHMRQTRINEERIRDQYVIAGLFVMFIGGTTDYLPSLGIIIYPLGIIGNIIFCLLATVAMLRYNLLKTKAILRRGTAYSLVSMLVVGVFGSLIFGLSILFNELLSPLSLTITMMSVFVTAALFQPVLSRIQRTVDRWFFHERYNHIQALKRFASERKGNLDLQQLSSSLVTTIANAMGSRGVSLLLPSPTTGKFETYSYYGPKTLRRLSFSPNNPVIVTMKYHDGIIDSGDMDIIPSLHGLAENDRQALAKNGIELMLPLNSNERLEGMLLLSKKTSDEPYSSEDRQLLKTALDSVAVTLENAKLSEDAKMHKYNIEVFLRRCLTAQEDERKRISTELHDGLAQWLVSASYFVQLGNTFISTSKLEGACDVIKRAGDILSRSIKELRRIILDLHPTVLAQLGLIGALREQIKSMGKDADILANFEIIGSPKPLSAMLDIVLYRICLEALNNVWKHAFASKVEVKLMFESESVLLQVADNGRGFNLGKKNVVMEGHIGLLGMIEKAEMVGGRLVINTADGKGTMVSVTVPYNASDIEPEVKQESRELVATAESREQ